MDFCPVSGLKTCLLKPVASQSYLWLYFSVKGITHGLNFQAAPSDWFF